MDDNQTNQTPWYLRGNLKDWALIIGGIGFFYLNTAGSNAQQQERQVTIQADLLEIKNGIKEGAKESKIYMREIEMRLNNYELQLELLKKRVEQFEKK